LVNTDDSVLIPFLSCTTYILTREHWHFIHPIEEQHMEWSGPRSDWDSVLSERRTVRNFQRWVAM